jgi:small-conductance mechanosensitive channel
MMQPDFVKGSPLLESIWVVGMLVIVGLIAWVVIVAMRHLKSRLEKKNKSALLTQIVSSLSKPVVLLIISVGFFFALSTISYFEGWSDILAKINVGVMIVLITYGLSRIGGVLLDWYLKGRVIYGRQTTDEGFIRFMRRLLVIGIYAIGILVLLDYLNISITPFIASLGIGGLAIALALQPTLGNFFAGTQIVSDHVTRVGDYIELENGSIRGYVTDVGWRSTRILTPFNNQVIIPNSHLADSVIVNYYSPSMEVGVIVNAGVSYSSNLTHVENVALTVSRELINELDEAVKTFEPWFGYEEFGASNVNFWVWLQAKDRLASFKVKSELIKRLKNRFDQEGITINYPVQQTYLNWPEHIQGSIYSDKPIPSSPGEKV